MSKHTRPVVHANINGWIPCGLPSPGSRTGFGHAATETSVLTTTDLSRVECKHCRRAMRNAGHRVEPHLTQPM
jgi:hypothetical protein